MQHAQLRPERGASGKTPTLRSGCAGGLGVTGMSHYGNKLRGEELPEEIEHAKEPLEGQPRRNNKHRRDEWEDSNKEPGRGM